MYAASASEIGIGFLWEPRKPVTFGVFLMRWEASVGELHFGQHVAGEEPALGSVLLSVAYVHKLLNLSGQLFYPTC